MWYPPIVASAWPQRVIQAAWPTSSTCRCKLLQCGMADPGVPIVPTSSTDDAAAAAAAAAEAAAVAEEVRAVAAAVDADTGTFAGERLDDMTNIDIIR